MKDLLNKMSQLEALSAPKTRQVLNESSPAPVATATSKRSLKDVFNELHEAIPAGAKPLPVMDPTNKKTGMGFVTSNNPAVQNILKNLDPKDVQIMQAPGTPGQTQAQPNTIKPVGTTGATQGGQGQMGAGQQTMQEEEVEESGLQAYLGNKKYGKEGMDALRKAGREHAGKEKMANIRAKYDKMDEAHTGDEAEKKFNKYNAKELDHMLDRAYGKAKPGDAHKQKRAGQAKNAAYNIMWREKYGDLEEADLPSTQGIDNRGAGLGAGRSATTLESKKGVNPFPKKGDKASAKAPAKGKKPDFLDLDKDGDKKEPMKKAASDKKKQKVKEGMSHRINAARLEGKSHGLKGHAYCGKNYDDMEEGRAYHEGFKEGLDECYGMGPIVGLKREARLPATTRGMARNALDIPLDEMDDMEEGKLGKAALALGGAAALAAGGGMAKGAYDYHKKDPAIGMSQSDMDLQRSGGFYKEDEMEEGNAFTGGLAKTKRGGQFKVGGKTFTDTSSYDSKMSEGDFAFEAWDRQLNSLINEGLSVSISKGNTNSPDSVNVNATDAEADKLLSLVKQAGMGIFNGDDGSDYGAPEMGGASEINSPGGIEVVGDHDGMLGLMKKLSGIQGSSSDYEDEGCEECGHSPCGCNDEEEMSESRCNECGMMESKCGCNEEVLDEVESEDQMEFKVAEGGAQNPPDSGAANATNDTQGNAAANAALAKADAGQDIEDGMQDQSVQESDDEEEEDFFYNPRVPRDQQLPRPPKEIHVKESDDEEEEDFFYNPRVPRDQQLPRPPKEINVKESFMDLYKKLAMLSEESTEKEDKKAEKAGKKVTKDIEYDDKKDKKEKVDEWANQIGKGPGKGTDASFEQDIDFMTKVIAGGLNKPKSTGQTTVPVVASQLNRLTSHDTTDINESVSDWKKLAGIK